MVECRTPEREVRGSRPTAAVLCPWARHFTPRKYWLITQEAMAPSRHDWKIVDWDVKPQHNQPTNLQLTIRWLIKHFKVIYSDANIQVLTLNLNTFCREKISLSGTPISLPKIADLPIWAQEKITCMLRMHIWRMSLQRTKYHNLMRWLKYDC